MVRRLTIILLGLGSIALLLLCAAAFSPLYINRCASNHFTEEEKEYMRTAPEFERLREAGMDLEDMYIPCGAEGLPFRDRRQIAFAYMEWRHEMSFFVIRVDFEGLTRLSESDTKAQAYYFVGYGPFFVRWSKLRVGPGGHPADLINGPGEFEDFPEEEHWPTPQSDI